MTRALASDKKNGWLLEKILFLLFGRIGNQYGYVTFESIPARLIGTTLRRAIVWGCDLLMNRSLKRPYSVKQWQKRGKNYHSAWTTETSVHIEDLSLSLWGPRFHTCSQVGLERVRLMLHHDTDWCLVRRPQKTPWRVIALFSLSLSLHIHGIPASIESYLVTFMKRLFPWTASHSLWCEGKKRMVKWNWETGRNVPIKEEEGARTTARKDTKKTRLQGEREKEGLLQSMCRNPLYVLKYWWWTEFLGTQDLVLDDYLHSSFSKPPKMSVHYNFSFGLFWRLLSSTLVPRKSSGMSFIPARYVTVVPAPPSCRFNPAGFLRNDTIMQGGARPRVREFLNGMKRLPLR